MRENALELIETFRIATHKRLAAFTTDNIEVVATRRRATHCACLKGRNEFKSNTCTNVLYR